MKKAFLFFFLSACAFQASAQIPALLTGNWIDPLSNEWTYGFFDEYAIYDTDFWDYESVDTKKNKTTLVLRNGDRTLRLELAPEKNGNLSVRRGREKARPFVRMGKAYPRYTVADTEPFPEPTFTLDSATLIGVYRGFDRIPERFQKDFGANFLTVSVPDFLSEQEIDYRTSIDSLGRFEITVPLLDAQEVLVDVVPGVRRGRTIVLQPGDRQLLFVNLLDLVPQQSDGGMEGYEARAKEILFMGTNARLNNELTQYRPLSLPYVSSREMREKGLKGMDFLGFHKERYDQQRAHYDQYVANYPAVSEKFRFYMSQSDRYMFAHVLIKHRFDLDFIKGELFPEGYMEYVDAHFPISDRRVYALLRFFRSFLDTYVEYKTNPDGIIMSGLISQDIIVRELERLGKLTPENREWSEGYVRMLNKIAQENDPTKLQALFDNADPKTVESYIRFRSDPALVQVTDELEDISLFENRLAPADSLLAGLPELRELWDAATYWWRFDHDRIPLAERQMAAFDRRIRNPYYRTRLLGMNDYYAELTNRASEYESSLKDTRELESIRNPEELFAKLIEPYRDKVIYVDFWGTWCAPCRENMKLMPTIKEELADREVIFMYFANNSPEQSWKSVIKEMGLTAPNVVHYRLPDEQEALIERYFSIDSFPTYLLVDRQGNVLDRDAPDPRDKNRLFKALDNARAR